MSKEQNALKRVEQICSRFHAVAKQLKSRYSNRAPFEINDEYDTQDLLHALLRIFFDDIREEEWVPSYAGSSSRLDFLLKKEKIVIEVKKTRKNLKWEKIRAQLIEDREQYQNHQDCKTLICFVYDPDVLITNPIGIENDLSLNTDDFVVKVFIFPKLYYPSTLDEEEVQSNDQGMMTPENKVDRTENVRKNRSMLIIKLHEATKEFRISNKLAMFFLKKLDIPVKSHSSVITMEQLELLREFSRDKGKYSHILEEYNRLEKEKRKDKAKVVKKEDKVKEEKVIEK